MQIDETVTTTEELLTAVADPQRRELLRYLRDTDGDVISVGELAAAVAESDDPDERDRLQVALQHAHLPKLADTGVLAFDPRSSTVRYAGDDRWVDALAWDFGDGTTGEGWWASHEYDAAGTYTVELTATDNTGHTTTDTVEITVE